MDSLVFVDSLVAQLVEFNVLLAVLALSFVEELSALEVLVVVLSPVDAVAVGVEVLSPVVAVALVVDELSPVVEELSPALDVASVSDEFVAGPL
ncbi:hypothetical protein K1X09_34100, partial [Paenibacillus lautus]|nr:hypothetical protein [Paenibacillus lautus]